MRRNILHKTSKLAETNDQTVKDDKKNEPSRTNQIKSLLANRTSDRAGGRKMRFFYHSIASNVKKREDERKESFSETVRFA